MAVFNKCNQGSEVSEKHTPIYQLVLNSVNCFIQLLLTVIFTAHSSISVNYPVINNANHNTTIVEKGSKNV